MATGDNHRFAFTASPNDEHKTMFGKEQFQWLLDGLTSSTATFKIVANGNQMLNPSTDGETLYNYRHQYDSLLSYIKHQKISGVLFLSGDRHLTELVQLSDTAFYTLYDYTNSSLTAGLSSFRDEGNPNVVPGTLVNDAHNFGLLRFSGPRTNRKVVLECWDYTGKLRWTFEIKASDLRARR